MGGYFVFGDIKGGRSFKYMLAHLLAKLQKPSPTVLYLGAASLNDLSLKACFEKGLHVINPAANFQSLNLFADMSAYDGDARPGRIEKRFGEADVVFYDGGGIEPLKAVFERFDLADYSGAVRGRGGYVGGLCGGGSYLGQRVVARENGDTRVYQGAGLIEDTAISCHVDMAEQREMRLYLLRDVLKQGFVRHAIGLGHNQAVVFDGDGVSSLPADAPDAPVPFAIDTASRLTPIPPRA